MFDSLVSMNLLIREFLNGGVFPLSMFLSVIIGVYLFDSYRTFGRGWTKQEGVSTACALWWVFTAESARAGLVWWSLRTMNDGNIITLDTERFLNMGLVIAGFCLVATILRCTYLFTPPKWGNKVWIASALTTIVFLIISHLLGEYHYDL